MEKNGSISSALAANMTRLKGERSIEALRLEMKEAGYNIGTQTLHRALLGKAGNRLASLQKIAAFFQVNVEQLLQPNLGADMDAWPFSAELYAEVSSLPTRKLQSLEGAMWMHLEKPLPDVLQRQLKEKKESAEQKVGGVTVSDSVTDQTQPTRSA